jgi:hypothetical protein
LASIPPLPREESSRGPSVGSPLYPFNAPYTSPLRQDHDDHDSREPSGGGRSRLFHLLSLCPRPRSPGPLLTGQLYLHLNRNIQPDSHDMPASPYRQRSYASCPEYIDSGVEPAHMARGSRPVSTVEKLRLLQAFSSTKAAPSFSKGQHNSSQAPTSLRSRRDLSSSNNQGSVAVLDRMRSLQSCASTESRSSASSMEKQGETPQSAGDTASASSSDTQVNISLPNTQRSLQSPTSTEIRSSMSPSKDQDMSSSKPLLADDLTSPLLPKRARSQPGTYEVEHNLH